MCEEARKYLDQVDAMGGVVAGIERLARLGSRAPNLALSLHAPDDATRARLVPMPRLASVARTRAQLLARIAVGPDAAAAARTPH